MQSGSQDHPESRPKILAEGSPTSAPVPRRPGSTCPGRAIFMPQR